MQLYMIHNGQTYDFDENQIIIDNYNETLDSMSVHISHSTKINIKPFDRVFIVDDDNSLLIDSKYYEVDSWIETQDTLGSNANSTYSYEISLFSPTKEMEGIILPNLSITPNSTNRSVYYYINQYNNLYGAKIRRAGGFVNKWSLDSKIYQRFNSIKCPELQWNAPTFREVMTTLMQVDDCIPIIKNNKIDFIDLTEVKDEIKLDNINYMQRSMSSNDFVSELQMDMQNVLQTSVDNVKDTIVTSEYIPITSNDYAITSDNVILKTKFPILKIKHLWMVVSNKYYTDQKIFKIDLANDNGYSFIKESKEYQTLEVLKSTAWHSPIEDASVLTQFQNFCIFYTRGSNEISGFTNQSKKVSIFGFTTNTLEYLIDHSWFLSYGVYQDMPTIAYYNAFFKVEYETSVNQTFRASKQDYVGHNRVVVDNQQTAWVDSYAQSNLEYQKANRLGNEIVMMNQKIYPAKQDTKYRGKWIAKDNVFNTEFTKTFDFISNNVLYHNMSCVLHEGDYNLFYGTTPVFYNNIWVNDNYKIIDLGDSWLNNLALQVYYDSYKKPIKIGDYYPDGEDTLICYQTQYQVYKDHIEVNAFLTKNYILRDYYTGINSKIRTWKNASDEAFERQDIKKKYCLLDFTAHVEQTGMQGLAQKLLSPLKNHHAKPIQYVLGRTIDHNTIKYPSSSDYCILPLITRPLGKSIVLTTGMDDNTVFDKQINIDYTSVSIPALDDGGVVIPSSELTAAGGIPLNNVKYVDSNYEFETIELKFVSDIDIGQEQTARPEQIIIPTTDFPAPYPTNISAFAGKLFRLPVVDSHVFSNPIIDENITLYKDNKEIPKITLQYEFCTKDRKIYFTRNWVEQQQFIKTATHTGVKVWKSDVWKYGSEVLPFGATALTKTITLSDTNINVSKANIHFNSMQDLSYLYITDMDNNIMLGLQINDSLQDVDLYLSIVLDRDLSIYDNNNEKVGTI